LTVCRLILVALLATAASHTQTAHVPGQWPVQDGNYVIKDFHFGSGESLPELKLHYLTLGQPHRDRQGASEISHALCGNCNGSGFDHVVGVHGRVQASRCSIQHFDPVCLPGRLSGSAAPAIHAKADAGVVPRARRPGGGNPGVSYGNLAAQPFDPGRNQRGCRNACNGGNLFLRPPMDCVASNILASEEAA
jgi:hypothetical protein